MVLYSLFISMPSSRLIFFSGLTPPIPGQMDYIVVALNNRVLEGTDCAYTR